MSPSANSAVYAAGTDGYHTYRVPAIIRTPGGQLLAFAEGRRDSATDSGDIDVVLRRSVDGGEHWEPLQVVLAHGTDTAGNPAPVIDPASGDVVLLSCRNGGAVTEAEIIRGTASAALSRRVYVQRSPDEGLSWSEPVEITAQAKAANWRWYATGPGHAIALRHGDHTGRLVCAANHSIPGMAPGSYGAHALLSDDGGHTWRIGAKDQGTRGWLNPNESTVAELPDGTLLFNARDQDGRNPANRAQARSRDGGETFSPRYEAISELNDTPVCQGSLLAAGGAVFFSAPNHFDQRVGMAIRRSTDGGSWQRAHVVTEDPAAYSDLVDLGGPAGSPEIGLLYETGTNGPYEQIRFQRLNGLR